MKNGFSGFCPGAAGSGSAAYRFAAIGFALGVLAGCAAREHAVEPDAARTPRTGGIRAYTALPPSDRERYCAWFGDARGQILYVGEAPFWSAQRAAGGDPLADLAEPGPKRIGRFDLAGERWLPPLDVEATAASGTWDVLAHPNGRVYFSDLFGVSGWVDPQRGETRLLPQVGPGLNELALGPEGRILATRYGGPDGGPGSLVVLSAEGALLAEHPLAAPAGFRVAAKSLAFDPVRGVVWLNTDLLPVAGAGATGHDARVLELASGSEQARFAAPELHFVHFARDGRGWFAWLDGDQLLLRRTEPGAARGPDSGQAILLDPAFPAGLDFVQELRAAPDGSAIATRWSGLVHEVSPAGAVRSLRLPRLAEGGLYYSAFAAGPRLCASYCAGLTVVCAPRP